MSFENSYIINKDNLDFYLNELSKTYKKIAGRKATFEIILIGGAAIIENYGFRDMTTDIDAIYDTFSSMKEAINIVGDKYNLPNGWLNDDFKKTLSYTPKLYNYSVPYKTFNQVLNVRTITAEYMIAMKLRAGRQYKNDLSDIVGILYEHEKMGEPITFEQIDIAVKNLYGSWDAFDESVVKFIKDVFADGAFEKLYAVTRENEKEAKSLLVQFEKDCPGLLKTESVNSVLEQLRKRCKE
ncbi:MAG: hypothetical protein IJM37_09120 [Lachnospiraceae bacterium]|nr:hypothetical protein [Lachnospiraceae bacterium]